MQPDARIDASPNPGARVRSGPGSGALRGARSRHGRTLAVGAVLALVAALAIGRFLTASTDPADLDAPVVTPTVDSTIARLEGAVATSPADGRSWQMLGAAYLQKLVQTADPAYADLTRRSLDRADALLRDDVAVVTTRAQLALTLHQFDDARALGERARLLAPSANDALIVLVDADVELGRYEEAAATLQVLLDRKPGLAALTRASYLRELYGDVDGALDALRAAQSAAAGATALDIATVDAIRGDLLANHGRRDEARAAYAEALARNPDNLVAVAGTARLLATTGDLVAAAALLAPLAERYPTPTLMTLQGDIAALDGRTADAAEAYAIVRATTALDEAGGAAVDLEAARFEADHGGSPALVLDLAARAYAQRPSIHGADALAWARYRSGDLTGASTAIDEALRLGTRDASLLFHAAAIHGAAGDEERARRELRDAFAINPWFALANRDEVRTVAAALGVATPSEWGDR